uniref:RlpA-like protein double-psi beta-barrel domain-containing protein n=1 Tax=Gossypium raimondii TaxID=29730 RepID=A0A0D2SBX2_GOSRA|nr:hypothetical protein B456_009G320200 [Gossypium raimondii]
MKKQVICSTVFPLLCILLLFLSVEAQTCSPSGKIKGKTPPPGQCNQENDSDLHSDDDPVVALSTGWYNNGKRCLNYINIHGNGKSVRAKVVDECDSTMGCDSDHDYQPPCPNNIVDASKAVWKALGVPESDWGGMDIYWSDTD